MNKLLIEVARTQVVRRKSIVCIELECRDTYEAQVFFEDVVDRISPGGDGLRLGPKRKEETK